MNEGIVERGENVGHGEHELTLAGLGKLRKHQQIYLTWGPSLGASTATATFLTTFLDILRE
jgi:hypothetical protein